MVLNISSSVSSVTAFCKIYFKFPPGALNCQFSKIIWKLTTRLFFNSNRVRVISFMLLNCHLDNIFVCKTMIILWAMIIPISLLLSLLRAGVSRQLRWDRLVTHSQVPEPTCYWKRLDDGRKWGGEPVWVTHRLNSYAERSKFGLEVLQVNAVCPFNEALISLCSDVLDSDLVFVDHRQTCLL